MIIAVLDSKKHPEQGYKLCLGILNLQKKYGNERLNSACHRALTFNYLSFRGIKNILENGLDKVPFELPQQKKIPLHENIRGNEYYH